MGTVALHLDDKEDLPNVIVKCPVCAGSGSIQCMEDDCINPFCLSLPLATEERCNCCDGRGWVRKEQQECSSFCRREKKEEEAR